MNISKKGEYALRTLINLGLASEAGRTLVQVSELADNERLPLKFLEQIMRALKAGGFVKSERGKYGGYRLGKPARSITIGSVVRAIDGPLAPIGCVSQMAYEKCSCPDEAHCGLRMLMLDVRNAIADILDRYSLADVVEVTLRRMRRDGVPLPFSHDPLRRKEEARSASSRHWPGARGADANSRRSAGRRISPTEGVIHNLLADYTI
jgi:Rrf2 family protein